MAADGLDQLSRLGEWLERESGDSLRPVSSTDVAQEDEIVVLEPDSDHSRRSRSRRWPVAVSATAAVIVLIVLMLDWGTEEGTVVSDVSDDGQEVTDNVEEPASTSNPAPPTTAPPTTAEPVPDPMAVEVVAALFNASNAGDVETYMALQSQQALTEALGLQEPFREEKARDSFLFLYLMGAEWVLTDCTARTATAVQGDVVFCQLSVDADWLRAYGLEDPPSRVRFVVDDGIVTENSASIILRSRHAISGLALAQWLFDNYEAGFTEACGGVDLADFNTTPRCAELMQLHLDEWASYLETDS